MLEETDTDSVTVTVAETGTLLVEVSIIQKLLVRMADAVILYVLLVFTDVVQENVQDVMVVHHMLMDITFLTSVL